MHYLISFVLMLFLCVSNVAAQHNHPMLTVTDTHVATTFDSVPRFAVNADFIAIKNGNWSDPEVWNKKSIPVEGAKVSIPAGIALLYDLHSTVRIKAIEISGQLKFATNRHTSLWVSEIMVMPEYMNAEGMVPAGTLMIGNINSPIEANYQAEIVITDGALQTATTDPSGFGKGMLIYGNLEIAGSPKAPFARSTADVLRGDSQIELDSEISGWKFGDSLVIPETSQTVWGKSKQLEIFETEQRVLSSSPVKGRNSIQFDTALSFDHRGISKNSFGVSRFPHIANLSRNVLLRSENSKGTRGHFMAMGEGKIILSNVEFREFGRTSAASALDSTLFNKDGSVLKYGGNQVGRYSVHMHHVMEPFIISGIVVNNGLKWGIVVHDTKNGLIENNIVYDVDGSAIVTEEGTETGNTFVKNLVIKVNGGFQKDDARAGVSRQKDAQNNLVVDTAADGSGFWFRASESSLKDNYVYDAAGYGFNFNGYYRSIASSNPIIRASMRRQIEEFTGNEATSSKGGIWLSWSQGTTIIKEFDRQTFSDFLGWNLWSDGLVSYHEANLNLENMTFINDPAASNLNAGSPFRFNGRANKGMLFGNISYENFNIRLKNIRVEHFNIGIVTPGNAGPEGGSLDGAELRNYINIAYPEQSELDTFKYKGVTFLPSSTKRINTPFPLTPANVWRESVGTVIEGESLAGSDNPTPTPQPTIVPTRTPRPSNFKRVLDRIIVNGTESNDIMQFSGDSNKLIVTLNGQSESFVGITLLWGFAGSGNDQITNNSSIPALLSGGQGDDLINGGSGRDIIYGDDIPQSKDLNPPGGDDVINGGEGDDILYGQAGRDTLRGQSGKDRAWGDNEDTVYFTADDVVKQGGRLIKE